MPLYSFVPARAVMRFPFPIYDHHVREGVHPIVERHRVPGFMAGRVGIETAPARACDFSAVYFFKSARLKSLDTLTISKPLSWLSAVQLFDRRQLGFAGRAPSGPEIHHDDFAFPVGRREGFAVRRLARQCEWLAHEFLVFGSHVADLFKR